MTFALALAVSGLFFAGFFRVAVPRFETNDDPAMMRLCSGMMTGEPIEFLMFTNVLIGRSLANLYATYGGLNWYSAYLYATHFVATCAFLFVFLRERLSLRAVALAAVLLLTFGARFLLMLQFTTTATFAATSGVLLLVHSRWGGRGERLSSAVAGACLLAWAMMIRADAFYFITLLAVPLFGLEYCRTRSRWPLIGVGAAVMLAFAAWGYDARAYALHPDWQQFREYNAIRGRVHDYGVIRYSDDTKPYYDTLGWSENDAKLYIGWVFADEELYSEAKLQALTDRYGGPQWEHVASGVFFRRLLENADVFCLLTMLFASLLVLWHPGRRGRVAATVLSTFLMLVAVFAYSSLFRSVPARVAHPGMYFLAVLTSYLYLTSQNEADGPIVERGILGRLALVFRFAVCAEADGEPGSPPREPQDAKHPVLWRTRSSTTSADILLFAMRTACAATIVSVALYLISVNQKNHDYRVAYLALMEAIHKDLAGRDPEPVFMNWSEAIPLEWSSPFSTLPEYSSLQIIPFGWNTHSPSYRTLLKRHSISNVYRALYERPDVYSIARGADQTVIAKFVLEHFGVHIDSRQVTFYAVPEAPGQRSRRIYIIQYFRVRDDNSSGSADGTGSTARGPQTGER